MIDTTLLYRQVHPSWIQEGRPTSQTFKPTPKDNGKLSTYDGDAIGPQSFWEHFTGTLRFSSMGVLGLTVGEFKAEDLTASCDPLPDFPQHVGVDFQAFNGSQVEKKSKRLRNIAIVRGWLYRHASS